MILDFGFCGCANCSGSPTVEHTKRDFGLNLHPGDRFNHLQPSNPPTLPPYHPTTPIPHERNHSRWRFGNAPLSLDDGHLKTDDARV